MGKQEITSDALETPSVVLLRSVLGRTICDASHLCGTSSGYLASVPEGQLGLLGNRDLPSSLTIVGFAVSAMLGVMAILELKVNGVEDETPGKR